MFEGGRSAAESDKGLKAKGATVKTAKVAGAAHDGGKELRAPAHAAADGRSGRRLSIVRVLLITSLALGIVHLATFLTVAYFPVGVPGSIDGLVIGNDQSPIADANISVIDPPWNVTAVTDAGGNFTIAGVPSGKATLRVEHANYTTLTVVVYVVPPARAAGVPPAFRDQIQLHRGEGNETDDYTKGRDASVTTCLIILVIGDVLTVMGIISVLTRRRYMMAVLGGIGGVLGMGLYIGALLGILAAILVQGARSEFKDQRGLILPSDAPRLSSEDEDDEPSDADDDADEGEDEEGAEEADGEGDATDADEEEPPK